LTLKGANVFLSGVFILDLDFTLDEELSIFVDNVHTAPSGLLNNYSINHGLHPWLPLFFPYGEERQ
jgi:hypothetical protein